MDTIVHFIFPIIIALGARLHLKHGIRWVLFLAFLATMLDIDHFIGYPRGSLHNVFISVSIPMIFIVLTFKYEKVGIKWKRVSIATFLFIATHPLLDLFDDYGVALFYPLSAKYYSFSNLIWTITISSGTKAQIIGPGGISILLVLALLLIVYYLDEVIKVMQRKHENVKKALVYAFKKEEQKIKKEL